MREWIYRVSHIGMQKFQFSRFHFQVKNLACKFTRLKFLATNFRNLDFWQKQFMGNLQIKVFGKKYMEPHFWWKICSSDFWQKVFEITFFIFDIIFFFLQRIYGSLFDESYIISITNKNLLKSSFHHRHKNFGMKFTN